MTARQDARLASDGRNQADQAMDAFEEARAMPPGQQRTEALKRAGLLRRAADSQGLTFSKRGRPQSK